MTKEAKTKENQPKKKGKSRKKTVWITSIAVVLLLLVLLVVFAVPSYVSSEGGTSMIVGKVNNSIDGEVSIGDLSFGWWKGVEATDLTFDNPEERTSVRVARVSAKPKLMALMSGRIAVDDTVIDRPEVEMTVSRKQADEIFQAGTEEEDEESAGPGGDVMELEKFKLDMREGLVKINLQEEDGQMSTLLFKNIASKVDLNKPGRKSTFSLSLAVADNGNDSGQVSADGSVTPDKQGWRFKEGTEGTFNVNVKDLDLSSLRPLFALAGKDMQADGELNAELKTQIADGQISQLLADARLANFSQVVQGKKTELAEPVTLKADVSTSEDKVIINSFDLQSSFAQAKLTGTAESIDYTANADLAATQDFATQFMEPGPYEFSGKLQASGNAQMGEKIFSTKGNTTVEGLVLTKTAAAKDDQGESEQGAEQAEQQGPLRTEPTNLKIAYDIVKDAEAQKLTVKSMQLETDPQIAVVTMRDSTLPVGEGYEGLDASVNAKANLAELAVFAKAFDMIPADMILRGNADSEIKMTGTEKLVTVSSSKTTVADLFVQKEGQEEKFEDPSVNVTFKAVLEPEQKTVNELEVDVESRYIDIDKGRVSQSVKNGQKQLEGEFVAAYDLEQITPLIQPFLPVPMKMSGKRQSNINFSTRYAMDESEESNIFENLTGKANFGFDNASMMGMNFGKTDVNLDIQNGIMNIEPFETPVNDGMLRFAGVIDLTKKDKELRTPEPIQIVDKVNINDEMSAEMLKFVNPLFANQANISGIADFKAEQIVLPLGGGRENDINIAGTVAMSEVDMRATGLLGQISRLAKGVNGKIEVMPTDFTLQNGVLAYDNMQVNLGDNPLNFGGKIGLDKTLDMTIVLPYTADFETVKVGEEPDIRIPLPLSGTIDSPQLNVDKALGIIASEKAKAELRKALGGDKKEAEEGEDGEEEEKDAEDILKEEGRRILEDLFK
ncbi:putative protein involved in outer membrane biogenesis [Anaerohalosphaera lusitana]|uniref:Uncharacterized protein n=1 Tax=Anaerohalosphaera lusitana TaxID=1936003 RepID=A0A1U9NR28_9BACT|nr:hypothetical protein [Anaerohalosphaera lusitana]AQT70178.1 putative protein involved in outer membrane biogenesis [Anaerohalosphaera lusitana]